MKINRRTQVTSRDNHRAWFIRQGGSQPRANCAQCNEMIQIMTLEEAAVAADVEMQTIYTLLEAGRLHCVPTEEATLRICLNSLINFRNSSERASER